MAWVDAPLIDFIWIIFFHQPIYYNTPQLALFVKLTTTLEALVEMRIIFLNDDVQLRFLSPSPSSHDKSGLVISWKHDRMFLFLVQASTSFFPLIFIVNHLYVIEDQHMRLRWQGSIESMQWLELFRPFTAIKNLYLSGECARSIAPALQEFAS